MSNKQQPKALARPIPPEQCLCKLFNICDFQIASKIPMAPSFTYFSELYFGQLKIIYTSEAYVFKQTIIAIIYKHVYQ